MHFMLQLEVVERMVPAHQRHETRLLAPLNSFCMRSAPADATESRPYAP